MSVSLDARVYILGFRKEVQQEAQKHGVFSAGYNLWWQPCNFGGMYHYRTNAD